MARLTRAQQQARNRSRVLAAARDEFSERGFRDAKVDRIAQRAALTRGAVYSNFPSKRALYLSVLADAAEAGFGESAPDGTAGGGTEPAAVLGALARARLSGAAERSGAAALAEGPLRAAYGQLVRLDAILLGLALEAVEGGRCGRRVRTAEAVLTLLHGAVRLSDTAPGFVDPFGVVRACERLADLDTGDAWPPPHLGHVPPARPADLLWEPPEAFDAVRRAPAALSGDGVVAVLGLHRLEAVEEAVRAAPPGAEVTAAVVTGDPAERMPLARIVAAESCGALRTAFPEWAWPRLRLVLDADGRVARSLGADRVDDTTECAVRVDRGRIAARALGRGAAHAAAAFAAADRR
ncbi:TetR/AcrR family transcriptional regulator [Nocardiopsis sp. LOL_012]|uniref:TetR/AcrR family transcriptional regulator n=1 Tax=Nocardiopsis sp. LOL_012 TaxID=3345409 RepID=UPI003A87345E